MGNADAGVADGELAVLGPATRASSTVLAAIGRAAAVQVGQP
jgi:hypothetical protein